MAEYIKRDDLLRHYDEYYCKPCRDKKDDYNGVRCRCCGIGDAIDVAEDIPAADVRDNVHGKWVHSGNLWECSNCGKRREYILTKFCPFCGASMGR